MDTLAETKRPLAALVPMLALLGAGGCAPPTIPGADLVVDAPGTGEVIAQSPIEGGTLVMLRDLEEVHVVRVGEDGPEQVELSLNVGHSFARLVTAPSGEAFLHSLVSGLHRRSPDGSWSTVDVEPAVFAVGTVDDLWLGRGEGEPFAHWDGVRWSEESLSGGLAQVGPDTFLIDRDPVRVREDGRWRDIALSSDWVRSLAGSARSVSVAGDVTWIVDHGRIVRLSRRTWTISVREISGRTVTRSAQVDAAGDLYVYRVIYGDEVVCEHGGLGFSRDAPTCGSPRTGSELMRWDGELLHRVLSLDPDPAFDPATLVSVGDDVWLAGRSWWWRLDG